MAGPSWEPPDLGALAASLSPEERRSIITNDLPNAINQGVGVTEAREAYRAVGLGMQNQAFGQLYAGLQGLQGQLGPAASIMLDDSIPDQQRAALPYASDTNYLDVISMTIQDDRTGEIRRTKFHYYHNAPGGTLADILNSAQSAFEDFSQTGDYPLNVLSASLYEAFINPTIA